MSTFITPNHVGCVVRLRNQKITPIVSYKEDDIWCYKGLNGLAWRPDGCAGLKYDVPHPEDIVAFVSLLKRPTQSDALLGIYETDPTTKHTPGPWKQGKTLLTPITRKWSQQEWDRNEAHEKRRVYSNFTYSDSGRGRVLVAECVNPDDAPLIAAAPELLEALKVTTSLCRLKYGNLDAEVYNEILRIESIIAKAEGKP